VHDQHGPALLFTQIGSSKNVAFVSEREEISMLYRLAVLSDGKWKWIGKILSSDEEVEAAIEKILQHYAKDQVLLCEGSTPEELNSMLRDLNKELEEQKQSYHFKRKLNERREHMEASTAPPYDEPYTFTFPCNQKEFLKWLELFVLRRAGKLES